VLIELLNAEQPRDPDADDLDDGPAPDEGDEWLNH
jgi:hypothetical protein